MYSFRLRVDHGDLNRKIVDYIVGKCKGQSVTSTQDGVVYVHYVKAYVDRETVRNSVKKEFGVDI